jgi:hypothetical protein
MSILGKLVFLTFFFVVSGKPSLAADSEFLTKRAVEIEWDEVPYAVLYELEIYDGKHKRFIKTFRSKTNLFKLNVKMGKYYFRSRITDEFERTSTWTTLAELVIAPPPTTIELPVTKEESLYANPETGVYQLPLKWNPISGVNEYSLMVQNPEGQVLKEFRFKGSATKVELPPGQYQFRIKAILDDGTEGEPSAPTSVASVVGVALQSPRFQFHRDSVAGQSVTFRSESPRAHFGGVLYYSPLESNRWTKVKDLPLLKERKIKFDSSYRPGHYKLKLRAIARGYLDSAYNEFEFLIKPTDPMLTKVSEETLEKVTPRRSSAIVLDSPN